MTYGPEPRRQVEAASEPPDDLTAEQRAELEDATLQAEYRAEHLRQLKARHCPGCGEDEVL